ncbi:acetate kinase [Cyanobacterium aponinum AL20118]|uniref:Acetate kinase n=1 Tax=Cyanobacterium aponinum AL20115 TaxID=3090662 RepID=A0AAF1C669_9CHRO|nr:acetate kinase [Cyanobacterium aponinum]MBD2395245.1 acetate kinase [Cyanobacterium aponinum FACHB-4101]WPF89635.1 acetate kinase [Cyanobacterium aponinum AL20115]
MKVLVLNAGSSSQKSCLYDLDSRGKKPNFVSPIWEATIDWTLNLGHTLLKVKSNGQEYSTYLSDHNRLESIKTMLKTMVEGETKVLEHLSDIDVVGHRVVHGGTKYSQATLINSEVKATIEKLIPLAPNHNPAHLEGIESVENILGDIPQVAVFDTAFHTNMPLYAKIYPLNHEFYKRGIQRYGFHGISHEYVSQRTSEILQQPLKNLNLVTCHLGNGCSITAVKNGQSVNTTMGFTPLEGVMMGTRCGSIDPAIVIHLMTEYGYDGEKINHILNKESGLWGMSEISSDLRTILKAKSENNPKAILAIEMYIFRLQEAIASMLPSLGSLDALVFTAGVGENSAFIREKVCQGLGFLGLKLDLEKNSQSLFNENIATADSNSKILIIPTKEDWAIASQCFQLMESKN